MIVADAMVTSFVVANHDEREILVIPKRSGMTISFTVQDDYPCSSGEIMKAMTETIADNGIISVVGDLGPEPVDHVSLRRAAVKKPYETIAWSIRMDVQPPICHERQVAFLNASKA